MTLRLAIVYAYIDAALWAGVVWGGMPWPIAAALTGLMVVVLAVFR